ncbi:hypothetical protein CsSME_00051697 [Camellia sinensis var. sinensis]
MTRYNVLVVLSIGVELWFIRSMQRSVLVYIWQIVLFQEHCFSEALGAPAVVVSLALQGIFHGFKDTKNPVSRQVFGLTCKGKIMCCMYQTKPN